MPRSELTIGFTQHFALFLQERVSRAAVDQVVRDVGLPHPLLENADVRITLQQEAAFIEHAAHLAQDLDFALEGGLTLSVGTALPGYISAHSRTVRDAIVDAARFLPLVRPGISLKLDESGERAALRCVLTDPILERYPRHCEALFAGVIGQIRAFTARPFRPDGLSFVHDRAAIGRKARSGLGCEVTFAADRNEMVLATPVLDRPIRGRNDALRALLVEHGELLEQNAGRQTLSFAETVELAIQQALPNGPYDAESISRRLGVSRRTLTRRLSDSGTSFGDIVAQVRARVAARELRESQRRIGEISWRLGFRSQSSFSTAFRRATGMTPRAFRKSGASSKTPIRQFAGDF